MSFFGFNFSKNNDANVVGIDVGSSAIKVVQLKKKKGKAVLETYGSIALGPYNKLNVGQSADLPAETLSEVLSNILRESKVSTNVGGIAIPFRSSLTTIIEMPDVGPKKLAKMIPVEARKYIPVPISEVSLDFAVLSPDQYKIEKKSENSEAAPMVGVLIIAVHNDIIEKYRKITTTSQVNPGFFEIEVYSTLRSVVKDSKKPVMIFDLGSQFSKVYVVEDNIIKSSHTINKGSQDITTVISKYFDVTVEQAEILKREYGLSGNQGKKIYGAISTTLDYIFSDANRVLLNHHKRFGKEIDKVVLVGGGALLKGFAEKSREIFKTEVELGNPFERIEAPAFLEDVLREVGPEFAVAAGLALRGLGELN